MDGKRRIARHQQYAALYFGAQLEADKREYFLGSAKVDIDSLSFDPFFSRDIHHQNSERLLSSYELTGCLQFESSHHIPAVIDENDLAEALSRAGSTYDMAQGRDHTQWPMLSFTAQSQVECLRGKHRIDAARAYLRPGLRWWVVDFYSKNLSNELKRHLTTQTSNEQPISPGEVYFHILRCDPDDERALDIWWAQIQSAHERAELRRLIARTRLNSPFRTLSKIVASGRGMLAGSVGSILRLKCDEEIIRYLGHVYDSWTMLVGSDESDLGKIDSHTMESLEARVPALSRSDEAILKPAVEAGSLFGYFTRVERDRIWQRLILFPRRIPSLRLFFRDVIYLECLADCLKSLVKPVRRQSVREAYRAAFSLTDDDVPANTCTIEYVSGFEKSYRCLVLATMRQIESLKPGSVMLERSKKREATPEDPRAWHSLAQEAHRFGFRSDNIEKLRLRDPDRVAASSFLQKVRDPEGFEYVGTEFETLVDQVMAVLEQVTKKEAAQDRPCLTTSEDGEDRSRRAGRPYNEAYRQSARLLTYENVYREMGISQGEPTSFFVQRDIFWSFFGRAANLDVPTSNNRSAMSLDVGAVQLDPPEGIQSLSTAAGNSPEADRQTYGADEHGDRSLRRPSYSTISSSHYSQPSETPVDPGPLIRADDTGSVWSDEDELLGSGDDSAQILTFISLAGRRPEVLEQVAVSNTNDRKAKLAAGAYVRRGLLLYTRQLRSLCTRTFIVSALSDESNSVFLIPDDRTCKSAYMSLHPGRKRPGDDLTSGRPRKMYIV